MSVAENGADLYDEIVSEVQRLVNGGVCEVTLLGQNVNSYGKNLIRKATFTELLQQLDTIKGLERIRFTTSHPKDLSPELIQSFGYIPKTVRTYSPAHAVRIRPDTAAYEQAATPGKHTLKKLHICAQLRPI